MSELSIELGDEGQQGSSGRPGRVWRACLECRKKKSKCDGNDVCKPCRNRNRACIYPESNDNASTSRQFLATLDERFQKVDTLCQRMEMMMAKFDEVVGSLESLKHQVPSASVHVPQPMHNERANETHLGDFMASNGAQVPLIEEGQADENEEFEDENEDTDDEPPTNVQDHVMTRDSYGKLRYVGGTGTMVLIEALKTLSPEAGMGNTPPTPVDLRHPETNTSILELPFFDRGRTWPPLPFLPKAEQLIRPPRYVSDLLVNLYFDQLHFTMPVVYKPYFMQRYNAFINDRSGKTLDTGFLSVFFAVCACASGLLPREPGNAGMFTGLQYYESALLLHYKSTGEGSIEQVQCLALLSMCTAGWNTLTQSWKFAGQAVRAAQDLGLHRSPERGTGETLKEELCRRVWWSVYGLDRLLSICLGRPMGVEDSDCNCEIPLDLDDDELEAFCKEQPDLRIKPSTPSQLAGFVAFSKLCQISGKVIRAVNPLRWQKGRRRSTTSRLSGKEKLFESLDAELFEWLNTVPDSIRFSANSMNYDSPHLTMCVILYIVHAACVINLHRPLIPDLNGATFCSEHPSFLQCVSAARSCIGVAELIQARVPPSHHLAFCTHYLALSGVLILRFSSLTHEDATPDIEACIRYLTDLENVWVGARRSRLIIEELLKQSRISTSIWDMSGIGADEMGEYMLGQEGMGIDLRGFDFG